MMVQATALIIDNIGFSTANGSVMNILSWLLRTYFEKLCRDSGSLAEFAGRDFVTLDDVSRMFNRHSIDLRDLHDYLQQVGSFHLPEQPPLFPLPLSSYKAIVEKQELDQKEEEVTDKADINEKIHVNDDDNEQQDDRAFPNFFGACAPDLGITVKKFIPPLVEISLEADFSRNPQVEHFSFTIVRQDFFSVPCLSLKGVPESERHKEKKRRKKEKREQQQIEEEKQQKIEEEKRLQLEREKVLEIERIQAEEAKSLDQQLKVPKIKIRFGPGLSTTTPLSEPQQIQQRQMLISPPLVTSIDKPKLNAPQPLTKTDKQVQPSTSLIPTSDALITKKSSSPVEEIIFVEEKQQSTPVAKTPPGLDEIKKGAKKRKKSPKRAVPVVMEPVEELFITAPIQVQTSIKDATPKKEEAVKLPDTEKNKRKRKSPKRTSPSPPRKTIRASTPAKKEGVDKSTSKIAPLQNIEKKIPNPVPTKLPTEILTKSVPSVNSSSSDDSKISINSKKEEPPATSKRSRKSEKPTRVVPLIVSDKLTSEAAPSPAPSPIPSKALETILEPSKKKEKPLESNKKLPKISDTPSNTPQIAVKKPPMKLSKLLKPSTTSTPKNEDIKTSKSGLTTKSKTNEKIISTQNKSKSNNKTPKTPVIKTVEKATKEVIKKESKIEEVKEVVQPSPTVINLEDDQEEDVWICPVCSVAYVENGPDMVACDTCDRWFHWSCVGILIPPPDNASWYCNECKKKNKKILGTNSGGNTSRKSSIGGGTSNKKRLK
uniref:PHD-type domain-containing protein n=1 Tax=Meloidogyne incognita TaxID=6306 RepID=A0A914N0C4_MELIC